MQIPARPHSRREALRAAAATLAGSALTPHLHAGDPPPAATAPNPQPARRAFPLRECYCPAHFGNSYEAMGPREMATYIGEIAAMGFNRYADWITTTDICNPYTSDATWDLAKEQLDRKKLAFRAAAARALDLNLIVTPNHVYLDQLRPHYAAKKNRKIFGQLICPSHPEARAIILDNFRRWFDDLADAGIQFAAFTAFAYDYGGCDCERCRPWILTFARLMREIHAIALARHPRIEPWFCSWWWTPEEHALLNDWAQREAPGWLKAMTLHIEYGQTRFKDVTLPAGCRRLAFVHVGYGDTRETNDVYAKWGATIAPHRIPATLDALATLDAAGFQAYSEGVFDDCNKMLLAGIGSAKFPSADMALRAYARRHFHASDEAAARWATWLAAWGDRTRPPLPRAAEEFERLARDATPGWRVEHWRSKLELETIDRQIGTPKPEAWSPEKRALADRFFAAQERMYREVYRLGPLRHVLNPRILRPAWFDSWQKATGSSPGTIPVRPEA